jgi:hypothetical protein
VQRHLNPQSSPRVKNTELPPPFERDPEFDVALATLSQDNLAS